MPKDKAKAGPSAHTSGGLSPRRTKGDLSSDPNIVLHHAKTPSHGEVTRVQVRSHFATRFRPPGLDVSFATIFLLQEEFGEANGACVAAADALCMLQLGTTLQNRALLHNHLALYSHAAKLLSQELKRAQDVGPLLSAAFLLNTCEYWRIATSDQRSWLCHAKGIVSLLRMNDHDTENTTTIQGLSKLWRSWRVALSYGLATRDTIASDSQRMTFSKMAPDPILPVAIQVPRMLRNLDRAALGIGRCGFFDYNVISNALHLRSALLQVFAAWKSNDSSREAILEPNKAFQPFHQQVGELWRVFPYAFKFESFLTTDMHLIVWACLLELDHTISRILSKLGGVENVTGLSSHLDLGQDICYTLHSEAQRCAHNLCQCLASLSGMGLMGLMVMAEPLEVAERYFSATKAHFELAWCTRVRRNVLLGSKVASIFVARSSS